MTDKLPRYTTKMVLRSLGIKRSYFFLKKSVSPCSEYLQAVTQDDEQ